MSKYHWLHTLSGEAGGEAVMYIGSLEAHAEADATNTWRKITISAWVADAKDDQEALRTVGALILQYWTVLEVNP